MKEKHSVDFDPVRSVHVFYKWATGLALVTIIYNLFEGVVSVFFGFEDRTVALLGFGVDSFVEVISGVGIWHMIRRMKKDTSEGHRGGLLPSLRRSRHHLSDKSLRKA
jgi:hypothetical protein